jgi:hypothetical protein
MSLLRNRQVKAKRQRFFRIRFEIEADSYEVSALPCDPSIGRKAFRLRKLTATEPTAYDVRFTDRGGECECLGYLHHGHCKHIQTLEAAEKVICLK